MSPIGVAKFAINTNTGRHMSSLTWLDFSEQDQRRAMEVIDLFREEETRDELGIGVVRDALADLMFPGTSTIQTRARYLLFLPWVLQELVAWGATPREAPGRSRKLQDRIRQALMAGGEDRGVIGYRAGLHVQRLPSSVYWQGLGRLGIRRFRGGEADYYRMMGRLPRLRDRLSRADDGEPIDDVAEPWDPQLPEPPADWLSQITFELEPREADYLAHRVRISAGGSLLDWLIDRREALPADVDFPWDLGLEHHLPPTLSTQLVHARNFSEVMHGAALLYNLMLAEQKPGRNDWADEYRDELNAWWDAIKARRTQLASWDRNHFWTVVVTDAGGRVPPPSRRFIDAWIDRAFTSVTLADLIDDEATRELIAHRERQLKRGRARLNNPRALENWRGASGAAQLDYRWNRPIRDMVNDILAPLTQEVEHA